MRRLLPIFLLFLAAVGPARTAGPGEGFLHNGVTAHRGNSGEFPENTLPAFRSGIEAGADWIELDIFSTRDRQLVVSHDRTTKRVGDQDLSIPDSTFAELQAVDVATEFRKRHGKSLAECPPERLPKLEDVLLLVKAQHHTRVSIQPKMDCVFDAVALIKKLEMQAWVGFNEGNLDYVSNVKQLAPEIPVFWDRGETDVETDLRIAQERGFDGMVLEYHTVTPEKIAKIRAAGLEAGAWTVDDEPTMTRLLDLGVQRIYTDYPKRLLALKAKRRR